MTRNGKIRSTPKSKSAKSASARRARSGRRVSRSKANGTRGRVTVFGGIGRLVTCAGAARKQGRRVDERDLSIIENAALVSRAGRIVWVGPESELTAADRKAARRIDLGGACVVPGLVECHTHLVYAGSRAAEFERRLRGETYQSIAASGGGILSTVRATRAAGMAGLARLAQARARGFVEQGVTTIEAKTGYGLSLESEMKLARVAQDLETRGGPRIISTFLGAHAVAPEFSSAAEYLEYLKREVLPVVKKKGLASRVDIFVENGYFSAELARSYLQEAKKLGFAITVHADQLTRSGGARLAVELGAQSADHLLCVDESDITMLAASEVTCVALPTSDLYMRCPFPRVRAWLDAGARVALATDLNPGTAPSQDISLTGLLARVRPEMQMTWPEVLTAYTVSAAYALGLQDSIGSLEVGKRCDFAVLKSEMSDLFLSAGETPVVATYRDGECIFARIP